MISDKGKEIYNYYLKALAEKSGRPYKKRTNFDKLTPEQEAQITKLEYFFQRYTNIYPLNFFRASFESCTEDYLPLEFFNKYKATVKYTEWYNKKGNALADSDETIKSFIEGVIYICQFCEKSNLHIKQYRTAVNELSVPWFLIHLQSKVISFYHLHALNIDASQVPQEYKNIVIPGFDEKFYSTKRSYNLSTKLKNVGEKLRKQVEIN